MQFIKYRLIHALLVTLGSALSAAAMGDAVTLTCEIVNSHNMRTNQYLFGNQLADPNATIYFTTSEPHALSVEGLIIVNESVLSFTEEPNEYRILTFPDQNNFQNYLSINRTSFNVVHLRFKLKTDMSIEYNELGEELRCRISKPRI